MGMFRMFYLNQKQIDTQLQSDFLSQGFFWIASHVSLEKDPLTFPYTGCLIGILTMVDKIPI